MDEKLIGIVIAGLGMLSLLTGIYLNYKKSPAKSPAE